MLSWQHSRLIQKLLPLKKLFFFFILLACSTLHAQRIVIPLNEGWQFTKDNYEVNGGSNNAVQWQAVSLPHTWNAEDVLDDVPGYYRGAGWYRKKLKLDKALRAKTICLSFGAANQEATIFINGKKAGSHTGGYTAFTIPVSSLIDWNGENELLVKVDNSFNPAIPPLTADFTFYGGLYRQASLIALAPVHFSCGNNGSKSVFISTPSVGQDKAAVHIRSVLSNNKTIPQQVKISTVVYNAKGIKVAGVSGNITVAAGSDKSIEQDIKAISHPRLWSPGDPYLYKAVTTISDAKTGKPLDEITSPLGFRWFHFDAEKGFFLNGNPLKLVGASRHQDYKGMGNAVPPALARKDVALLKAMGGNFLRVAHYPQDPAILQACDELGLLASVEIPVVNEITESGSFYRNCEQMQVEMIRQHFNHPSVIIWCSMNEVLLRPPFSNDKERQKIYFSNVTALAKKLDSLTRKEDPSRYTMIAFHGDYKRYKDAGMIDVPMVAGWNIYAGWYGASINELPAFLDRHHKDYPGIPVMVTEYGADADPRIRSTAPVRFDKSVEYATRFHQYYFKEIMKRPFVAAAIVWNLADFNSETRSETMPHMNNKGLLEFDRTPKDPYYYYKAMLVKEPFVKILGTTLRGGIADSGTVICHQILQVASNTPAVELFVNGQSQGSKQAENGISEWNIPFANGTNNIEAKALQNGKAVTDRLPVAFCLLGYELDDNRVPFTGLNILLGANRSFIDHTNTLWLPARACRKGSWGYIGGKPYKMPGNNRLPYGTDKAIAGTDNDPVYQAQQTGIKAFHFDVPDGNYTLTLHFAELEGGEGSYQPYNLSDTVRNEDNVKRIFDVAVNDMPLLQHFNMQKVYGPATPIVKKTRVAAAGGSGITVTFKSIEGEPVLNAVQLKKQDAQEAN